MVKKIFLILGFSLILNTWTRAALMFTVDAVSANSITISIIDGSTLASPNPNRSLEYLVIDAPGSGNTWITGHNTIAGAGSGSVGGINADNSLGGLEILNNLGSIGDVLALEFRSNLAAGGAALGITNTFTSAILNLDALPGDLNPTDVGAALRLSWGLGPGMTVGTIQSTGAVPEANVNLTMLAIMSLVAFRRRRTA